MQRPPRNLTPRAVHLFRRSPALPNTPSATPSALPALGAHTSIAGGFRKALERSDSLGAAAIQIFLKNNNQWQGAPLCAEDCQAFRQGIARGHYAQPIAHSSYLINLASPGGPTAERSVEAMAEELRRAGVLDVSGVVMHPGAHLGEGEVAGLALIAERINRIFDQTAPIQAGIFLEVTAGQGTCLGHRFEHLAEIIARIENRSRIGICLDTCHVFAAGYDIRTNAGVKTMLQEFDRIIGLDLLRVIHVNDSKKGLGSRVDRHAHIGQGEIGEECFRVLLRDPALRRIPFILETPKGPDLAEDHMNLATLRRLGQQKKIAEEI